MMKGNINSTSYRKTVGWAEMEGKQGVLHIRDS